MSKNTEFREEGGRKQSCYRRKKRSDESIPCGHWFTENTSGRVKSFYYSWWARMGKQWQAAVGGQIPARSRGKGQEDQKQGLGEASEQRRLHPITLISPYRSVRSILGPLKDRSSCSRFWAYSWKLLCSRLERVLFWRSKRIEKEQKTNHQQALWYTHN